MPGADLLKITTPPPDLPEQSVVSYIVGYMLQKRNVPKHCETCSFQFQTASLPELQRYEFLKNKAYEATGCLVYPTVELSTIFDKLEVTFKSIFPHVLAVKGVMVTLNSHTEEICTNTGLACFKCEDKFLTMARLYIKVRVHHSLEEFNKSMPQLRGKAKRNRKMMKLLHV